MTYVYTNVLDVKIRDSLRCIYDYLNSPNNALEFVNSIYNNQPFDESLHSIEKDNLTIEGYRFVRATNCLVNICNYNYEFLQKSFIINSDLIKNSQDLFLHEYDIKYLTHHYLEKNISKIFFKREYNNNIDFSRYIKDSNITFEQLEDDNDIEMSL